MKRNGKYPRKRIGSSEPGIIKNGIRSGGLGVKGQELPGVPKKVTTRGEFGGKEEEIVA